MSASFLISSRRLPRTTTRPLRGLASTTRKKFLTVEQLARRVDLRHQKVLVRVDFNVPLKLRHDRKDNGGDESALVVVTDDTRLRAIYPTVQFLREQCGAHVMLLSHHGGRSSSSSSSTAHARCCSLSPVVEPLQAILGTKITKLPDCVGPSVEESVSQWMASTGRHVHPHDHPVLLLENTRWHAGETTNNPQFAAQLGRLANYYVNDAFAVAHRAHASTVGVTAHMQWSAAGYGMQREVEYLQGAVLGVQRQKRPLLAVVGGAKISSKLPVLESLLNVCDGICLGGGMIFAFYKAMGYNVGASLVDNDDRMTQLAHKLLQKADEKGVKLVLPIDVVVADAFSNNANSAIAKVTEISGDWRGLDIGPDTIEMFAKEIKQAKTIVMNGTFCRVQ